jgi:hypothetical protein
MRPSERKGHEVRPTPPISTGNSGEGSVGICQVDNSANPIPMIIPAPHVSHRLPEMSDPVFLLGFSGS